MAVLADAPPTIPKVPGLRVDKRKKVFRFVCGRQAAAAFAFRWPGVLGERLAKAREKKASMAVLRKKAEMKELASTVVNYVVAEAKVRVSVGVATWRNRLQRKVSKSTVMRLETCRKRPIAIYFFKGKRTKLSPAQISKIHFSTNPTIASRCLEFDVTKPTVHRSLRAGVLAT